MNKELYKKALTNEYKYLLDFMFNFGGKYALYKTSDLLIDCAAFNNKEEKELKKAIRDLLDEKLIIKHKSSGQEYLYFNTRLYREYFGSMVSVDEIISLFTFEIQDLKTKYIKKIYGFKYFLENFKISNIFNKSEVHLKEIYNTFTTSQYDTPANYKRFKSNLTILNVYNINFLGIEKANMNNKPIDICSYVLFLCDKDNSCLNHIIKDHRTKLINTFQDFTNYTDNQISFVYIVCDNKNKLKYQGFFNHLTIYNSDFKTKNIFFKYIFV